MGRPCIKIDPEQVKQLARIGCTYPEMAAVLGCSQGVLERRFKGAVKEGQEHLKASLRRMQYTSATNGSVAMQIWLGKQYLGQNEKVEVVNTELMKEEIEFTYNGHKPYNPANRFAKFINN